ncbi:MAG TPA: YncE family protein [Acidobacteriaceae bacterium]|nr:YncE family protein [Acidobacteriaceae bacterium]
MTLQHPPRHSSGSNRASHLLARCLCSLFVAASLFSLAGCRSHEFPDYPANYREYAYITNGGSNTVTVLDVVNLRQDRVIRVGSNPTGVAANTKRNEVYVVNTGSNSVSVIDAEKNAVVATIPVHQRPYFISVSADGKRAYVANSGSNNVSVIDLQSRRQIAVIGVGEGPGVAAVTPDGNAIVVSNRIGNSVSIIDAKTEKVRSVWSGCRGATDIAILPDSSKAFVACSGGHQVMAIALATPSPVSPHARSSTQQAIPKDELLAVLDVGKTPLRLILKPDGGEIFAINYDGASLSEIDTSTNEVGGAYMVGTHPVAGVATADNSLLYVSDFDADSLGVYSIDDGELLPVAPRTGDGPESMAFSKAGNLLFVVDTRSGDVAVIRTSTNSLLNMFPVGAKPNDIAVKAFLVPAHPSL